MNQVEEPTKLEPAYMDLRSAARRLGLKRSTAYYYAAQGLLPSLRLGGRLLIPVEAVEALATRWKDGAEASPTEVARAN